MGTCRKAIWTLGAVALLTAVTGCAASSPEANTASPTAEVETTDVETCVAFGDVITIISNASIALQEGRAETQERDGWYRIATRVLDRIPTTGEGAVHDAITQLREVAPAVEFGVVTGVDFDTMEWADASSALAKACDSEGVEMIIEGFTGG